MGHKNQKLVFGQVNSKIKSIAHVGNVPPPGLGWINGIRVALNMTMEQLGDKLGMSLQSISEAEQREREGTITLKSLMQIARALDMKLFYAIIPENGDLNEKIEQAADTKAKEIVKRTSQTMVLEDQANDAALLQQMLADKKQQLIADVPKMLWE